MLCTKKNIDIKNISTSTQISMSVDFGMEWSEGFIIQ